MPSPAHAEINPTKRQIFVDGFKLPPGWGKAKRAKSTPKPKATRPRKTPKQRNNRKINRPTLTPEEKVQRRREYEQKRRQLLEVKERIRLNSKARYWKAKELGLCKEHCGEPATPGKTRCETCAEKHRVTQKLKYANRQAQTKQTRPEEKLRGILQEHVNSITQTKTPLTPKLTKTPERREEYERARSQKPERKQYRRQYNRKLSKIAHETGKCKHCPNPAILGQTRCETCAERHREYRRRSDAKQKAMAKQLTPHNPRPGQAAAPH